MPNNIVDVDTFTDPLTTRSDGDAVNAANVLAHCNQGLANRTLNLANRIGGKDGSEEWEYNSARTRKVIVGPREGNGESGWAYNLIDRATGADGGSDLFVDLTRHLPSGCVLTEVECFIKQTALGSAQTEFKVYRTDVDFDSPAEPPDTQLGSTPSVPSNAYLALSTGVISQTVDRETMNILAWIRSPVGSDVGYFGLRLTFQDPGPRNY